MTKAERFSPTDPLSGLFNGRASLTLGGVPDGLEGRVLARVAASEGTVLFVARDARGVALAEAALTFFAPDIPTLTVPAWDSLPYDRVSPNPEISAERMSALHRLLAPHKGPRVVFTTANAIVQRLPDRESVAVRALRMAPGNAVGMDSLSRWLEANGFDRTATVRDLGEYAVRGGILDLWAPGTPNPIRLDFFGDTLETIRPFAPDTQRTSGSLPNLSLVPANEAVLTEETISRFRQNYRAAFGAVFGNDPLYEAVSEGRRFAGMEHWLPFFYEKLETLFAYLPDAPVIVGHLAEEALADRQAQIRDHYQARQEAMGKGAAAGSVPYKPIPPDALYLSADEWQGHLAARKHARLSPFVEAQGSGPAIDIGGRTGRSFAAERAAGDVNVFDALVGHVGNLEKAGRKVMLASWSEGARDRLGQVLIDHGLIALKPVASWSELQALPKNTVGLAVLALETGFEAPDIAVIGDQDVLGDRYVRAGRKRKRAADALTEVASLAQGDLVVHVDHGIGRFAGLRTIEAAGAPHDCLEILYAGNDRLFLPVENIELLTRYGAEGSAADLDRLGGVGWQTRKARLKKRIRDMAEQLIKTAAARLTRAAPALPPPAGLYDEFAARFPYEETEDQSAAIEATLDDLSAGRPMDRLVCGDVGFGKTEVALRAAFVAAMNGKQVALVAPTTLLARQHTRTFLERFRGLPVNIGQASRLVGAKELAQVKAGIADGTIDIAIGTHALLGKAIDFKDLGLLIVDEEQHFGVKHKERLKELRAHIHVLTLSATPIPRTLQLALTGVRDLSMIATPPIDRLAVRTFISPFDTLTIREALLRERLRGGQSFYVVPRISDLAEIKEFLDDNLPEAKVGVAHGQMPSTQLEQVMNAFYDGQYDILLSTTIVESGLDIPRANTLVVHRADIFGLAQLYQLRGRIGRSKLRAYSLFTHSAKKKLTDTAQRRLKVLQSLDTLGAGFQLASHDLDIRGSGNLLGEEQSGHIKEVGFELYQQMLEEAVASLKAGGEDLSDERWSPQITVGMSVMIPEVYVPDLQLRMNLYRRLADLDDSEEIDAFGAEMIDRFGPLPEEVEHLLKIVYVKALCRRANVEKVDAGPKGAVIAFRGNAFAEPAALIKMIAGEGSLAKVRPDQRVVFIRDWESPADRLKGVAGILQRLVGLAEKGKKAA